MDDTRHDEGHPTADLAGITSADLTELAGMDPAEAPDPTERIADRLQEALDGSEGPPPPERSS